MGQFCSIFVFVKTRHRFCSDAPFAARLKQIGENKADITSAAAADATAKQTQKRTPGADHGTVLRRDQFAIAANMDGSFSFFVSDFPEDVHIPRSVLLIAAVAAKIKDEKWIDKMIGGMVGRLIDEAEGKEDGSD